MKIAYCAGHHLGNPKGIPGYMGLGDVREWTLNDRVARYFAEAAGKIPGVELLRTDDPTGATLIDIPDRCAKANAWGADVYLDIHHNGGINGGSGGGVCVFSRPGDEKSRALRDKVYEALMAAGCLRGNRASPLLERNFDTVKYSKMPAVLVEYGFMDSRTDAPVILTEDYARKAAAATLEAIAGQALPEEKPKEEAQEIYRIRTSWENAASQVGAFVSCERAEAACPEGYSVYNSQGEAVFTKKKTAPRVEAARAFTKGHSGSYRVNSPIGLKLRAGAGMTKAILETMKNGSRVMCYGYHTGDWLYVVAESGQQGFCHKSLLKRG